MELLIIILCTVIAALIIVYDMLVDLSADFFKNGITARVLPWYVRVTYWVHSIEFCRVQNVVCEKHIWFGGLINYVGRAIRFIR